LSNGGPTYRLNATNPGQFYYNVFYVGTPGSTVNLNINIPYPFVTNGANPIQVHDGFSIVNGCYVPSPSLGGFTIGTASPTPTSPSGYQIIGFEDYSGQNVGTSTTPVTVGGIVPGTGLVYVTIHLEYGLKGTPGWKKVDADGDSAFDDARNDHVTASGIYDPSGGSTVTIYDPQTYHFSFLGTGGISDDQYPQSFNAFKKSAGSAGQVLAAGTDDPIEPSAKVVLTNSSGKVIVESFTDEDGVYWLNYKHTGKAATYYVKVPAYGKSQAITLKANGFVVVNFTVP
jgi:hypothetical protein